MAEKTTAKPTAKATSKVFDIAKPGKQAANASSRPIIVTNRPIIQDPMVNSDEAVPAAPTTSPSIVKVRLQPPSNNKQSTEDAEQPAADAKPDPAAVTAEKPADAPAPPTKKSTESTAEAAPPETDDAAAVDEAAESELPSKETVSATDAPADADVAPVANPDAPGDVDAQADKATAELEAAAQHQEAINKLIEGRQYFLPINSIERRRSKITALLGFLLILVLGLLLLDIMLDAGFIRLSGVQPVTHFF